MNRRGKSFPELVSVYEKLLGPGGCQWDRKQTHRSLIRYLMEESRELDSAVRRKDWKNVEEELGDVLMQVVFHSELARRKGLFDIDDVICGIVKKLRRRHPHVFGNVRVKSAREVVINWNRIKRRERSTRKSGCRT